MEDLKDKIIYLQDELITCLKTISNLENDKRKIEYLTDSTIASLKRDIENFKIEKMKREYHKCENKEYPCDAIGEQLNKATSPSNDYSSSADNCCDKEYREEAF